MAGSTKSSTRIRTVSRSKSLPESLSKSSPKTGSMALAIWLVAAAATAALGQTPATQHPDSTNAGLGDSQIGASIGVSVGVFGGKLGSLSGKLTDLHSTPLDGATVLLCNTGTGAEVRTVTQKNGSYRFTGLVAGEYTLVAESKRFGQGSLEGILVSAGTEARVQTAMRFAFPAQEPGRRLRLSWPILQP
jgi:hypothetical protein